MEEKENPMPAEDGSAEEYEESRQEQVPVVDPPALEKVDAPVEEEDAPLPKRSRFFEGQVSYAFLTSVLCIAVVFSVLFTYTFATAANRRAYANALIEKQSQIDELQSQLNNELGDLSALAFIGSCLEKYSYYSDQMSEKEMINAAIKAYVAATGDKYAAYYTEEEYLLLHAPAVNYAGIGAYTTQSKITYEQVEYLGYRVEYCYLDSPAHRVGVQYGDFIYQIEVNGELKNIDELGGYDHALEYIKGEEGSTIKIVVLRDVEGTLVRVPFELVRAHIDDPAVYAELNQNDPTTAVVWIKSFDSTTPKLFKETVNRLLSEGVEHFVFDVRNNPGGDLRSIKSVLSYFLQKGDLIIQTVNKNGNLVDSVVVEPATYTGLFADCSITEAEIGIFAELDFAVLCNESTASAAEVFTATLRDYGMTTIVGQTTYGKGVLQSIYDLSNLKKGMSGYLKMTTHAYVTKCGTTYHDTGIAPSDGYSVPLSEEVAKYHVYMLYNMDQAIDNQLQAAFSIFH